jgi:hypothetical protein
MDAETERFLKFFIIMACFFYTFVDSGGFIKGKRDVITLRAALGLTVIADFLMVLRDIDVPAIMIFCVVQVLHNFRFTNLSRVKVQIITGVIVFVAAYFISGQNLLVSAAAAYSSFLFFSFTGAFIAFNDFPYPNNYIITLGMLLFVGCDIAVLLYNAPIAMFKEPAAQDVLFRIIWVCYLPAQLLLATSVKKINLPDRDENGAMKK